MFTLKKILKNVQSTKLEHRYVQSVILESTGINAMKLASRVVIAYQNNECIDFLKSDQNLIQETNISLQSEKINFCWELSSYTAKKGDFLSIKRLMIESLEQMDLVLSRQRIYLMSTFNYYGKPLCL